MRDYDTEGMTIYRNSGKGRRRPAGWAAALTLRCPAHRLANRQTILPPDPEAQVDHARDIRIGTGIGTRAGIGIGAGTRAGIGPGPGCADPPDLPD